MAGVIIGSFVTACFLLFQGVHVLRNGNLRPFYLEQSDDLRGSERRLSFSDTVAGACLYILPSVAVFCLLAIALFKADKDRIIDWLSDHVFELFGELFLLTYGLVALLRPDVVIRSLRGAFPDREREIEERYSSVKVVVRSLGAFLSLFSLYVLNRL
jgi:hypothetical protein